MVLPRENRKHEYRVEYRRPGQFVHRHCICRPGGALCVKRCTSGMGSWPQPRRPTTRALLRPSPSLMKLLSSICESMLCYAAAPSGSQGPPAADSAQLPTLLWPASSRSKRPQLLPLCSHHVHAATSTALAVLAAARPPGGPVHQRLILACVELGPMPAHTAAGPSTARGVPSRPTDNEQERSAELIIAGC